MVSTPDAVGIDAVIEVGAWRFLVQSQISGTLLSLGKLVPAPTTDAFDISLVVVPFMSEAGRRFCESTGTSWIDLSGNADIKGPGLRVLIVGQPNQFKRRGRKTNVFAPKSSRIARWLLLHLDQPSSQREIAQATGLSEGFVSRAVQRLEADGLLDRRDGVVRVIEPDLMLDAWAERYDFDRHEIHKGVVAARSGPELAQKLAARLDALNIKHAFTGLVAAWQWTHFAAFRLATVYVEQRVTSELLEDLHVLPDPRGANVWLLEANDVGVFEGATIVDGLRCVHPVQAWLDLSSLPERSKEAAQRLRHEQLNWG